jgi:hypothetical protein
MDGRLFPFLDSYGFRPIECSFYPINLLRDIYEDICPCFEDVTHIEQTSNFKSGILVTVSTNTTRSWHTR